MAASVRTPAVRMNERSTAESMLDATLSVPRMTGSATGALTAQTGNALDLVGKLVAVDVLTKQVLGVAGVGDLNATQHLTCEHLDVLVVQVDALGLV